MGRLFKSILLFNSISDSDFYSIIPLLCNCALQLQSLNFEIAHAIFVIVAYLVVALLRASADGSHVVTMFCKCWAGRLHVMVVVGVWRLHVIVFQI